MAKKAYRVFVCNWWKPNPTWPDGREPDPQARKTTLGYADTEEEAQAMCRAYNERHHPGPLSRKAEYTNTI
jgi:hypothetical protein